ncbi:dTMP kinase [Brevibacillus daliensis]|uniref:dTMP kinase n=1 Tax=Brevibacillus daliensis TaxID=2892995 RepID=UPI001E47716E|nr:dTMP kinase [Brevibacillus daliensis]
MKRGLFLTLEGGEGAGKSSVITLLEEKLVEMGHEVLVTREPGGVEIAEKIRHIILDTAHVKMDGRTEALLYAAARRQHLVEKVLPALEEGKIVLCDRFVDSSLAYQGYARGLGIEQVLSINMFAIQDCLPDVTLYLDVDPKVGLARIHSNDEREINRLDLEGMKFHEQVRAGYEQVVEQYPERILRIDANQSLENVLEQIISSLVQTGKF